LTLFKCAEDFVGDGFGVLMSAIRRKLEQQSDDIDEEQRDMFLRLAAFGFRFQHALEARRVAQSVAARAAAAGACACACVHACVRVLVAARAGWV
jgi:hypothetical protein